MKKIVHVFLLMLIVAFCLSGCSGEGYHAPQNTNTTTEKLISEATNPQAPNDETAETENADEQAYRVENLLGEVENTFDGLYVFEEDPDFYFEIKGDSAYLSSALEAAYGFTGGKDKVLNIAERKYDTFFIVELSFMNSNYFEIATDVQTGIIEFLKYTDEEDGFFYLDCRDNPRETMKIKFVKQ